MLQGVISVGMATYPLFRAGGVISEAVIMRTPSLGWLRSPNGVVTRV